MIRARIIGMTTKREPMPPGPAPKATGVKLTREQMNTRNEKIMRLFIAGHSPTEITRVMGGVTRQRVDTIIRREIQRGEAHRQLLADEARVVYTSRMETLIRCVWPAALQGDLKAVETARKLVEQQARGLGVVAGAAAAPSAAADLSEFDMDDPGDVDELALYRRRHRRREEFDKGL
jgi:hypothetical protein